MTVAPRAIDVTAKNPRQNRAISDLFVTANRLKLYVGKVHAMLLCRPTAARVGLSIFEALRFLRHLQAGQQLNVALLGTGTIDLNLYALLFACRAKLRPLSYERCSRVLFIA